MNESENNFESLRRLLALKRHEIPPPGYFNRFCDQVISRIRAGEAGETVEVADRLFSEAPWLLKLLQFFQAKPVYVSSFACSLCLLLLVGIIYVERPEVAAKTTVLVAATEPAGSLVDATTPIFAPSAASTGLMVSTNPVLSLQPVGPLFAQQNPLVQPVSFSIPGN